MATDAAAEDFVTIVPVGENRLSAKDPSFVTVLTVGAITGAAEIIVRRPRGERLGLGLKFEGGSAAAEKVRRLLVQSCAENSPAATAQAPWGKLIPGDEILAIDGVPVSELTRIDCVRRLKDSDESLTLLVRHFEMDNKTVENGADVTDAAIIPKQPSEIVRPTTLPPPVPPRKLGKKNSFKDKPTLQTVGEQNNAISEGQQHSLNDKETLLNGKHNGISTITKLSRKSSFDSHILRQNKEGISYFKKGSPEEVRRLVRRLSDGKAMPAEADVYIDLLSTEWERCLLLADAESDDTGSSISTVVERLGSITNSVENSIPSTPTMQPKTIDIQKVLNCIENIDTNILNDMTSKNFLEKQIDLNSESKTIEKTSSLNILNGHDATASLSLLTENSTSIKKIYHNDKNNNNTIISNNTNNIEMLKRTKTDQTMEKPKPMPRNTKIERSASEKKPRTLPIPEIAAPTVLDSLLTPTKKNCIETWLQRSEAEMKNKTVEKLEDNMVQEILPRLIDFVPKHQFKDGSSESPTLARPTTAPPPPPTETREDGSGASLDTIGELDETADVTANVKPLVVIETKADRKSSFERNFWEDRINKSDADDKNLSNDETPLPSCSRQPPDGVETPSDTVEKTPELPTRLPPRLVNTWHNSSTGTRSRFSYSSRTQDARSEASVKDKIAMFSNDHAVSTDRIDKCGTLPTRSASSARKNAAAFSSSYSDVSSLDRRLTKSQDNLDDMPKVYKRHTERPEVLGAIETVASAPVYNLTKIHKPLQAKSKPLFYGSTTILPSSPDTSFAQQVYHARSVSEDNSVSIKTNTSSHKSNLEYLIEQRKKSMSKLRGLVIPEVQGPIVDLPEIKVQDPVSKSFLLKSDLNRSNYKPSKPNDTKPMTLNDAKWKVNLLPNNIPKYSPAFKRKSLQVYTPSSLSKESTPERSFNDRVEAFSKLNNKTNAALASRASLDSNGRTITASFSSKALNNTSTLPKKDYKDILNNIRDCKNVEVKTCTATDVIDSDNDSAMSSTQSSYRSSASSPMHALDNVESDNSRLSPKITEYSTYSLVKTEVPSKRIVTDRGPEEYIKRNICRSVSSDTNVSLSSSAGSAATSGSQASCSSLESSVADSDKRKVSKAYNIDTINRRNILASAKCRSGRDVKLKSPVVETKFSHESCDGSPSPVLKSSERLSTLTPPVSAVSNKGENRRRNKIIADTDSDSDSDTNVRQRKPDYKNTRLKRNSSSTSKNNKQNESNLDSPKIEDAPKVISEKIIKEIKKAGLDDFTTNKVKSLSNKSVNDIVKVEKVEINKDEKNIKTTDVPLQSKNGRLEISNGKSIIPKGNHLPKSNKTIESSLSNNKTDINLTDNIKISTQIIRLKRGAGSGVGVILAGGIDCEAKDVTVHRVLADSVAAKAGLKRGVKVRSINGYPMSGLTHAQSVTILKEQRSEVVIEIENEIQQIASEAGCGSDKAESNDRLKCGEGVLPDNGKSASSVVSVIVEKAGGGAGLGFGLDGGRDSPRGDCPLTIKKLFAGGAAAQSGRVLVGAELLSAGGQSMEGFTRTQAWAALKALPAGPVCLVLKNPKD
ncbi:uncharacterized protein LOC115448894 [Manduca sexta]|uniref:PDZ domain-containing protein n=1 Tax=Manduca sexta TaxID=7130 RepID=A0A921YJW3_MANSE|nr:uncharacterized protein LOC115448894 [Manduca sexta]KAG6440520.1 hypothetical protein O3G_MSEX001290 [Manduca sexta]